MTDFTQTLPIRIPPDLLKKILNDGANADAAILAAEAQGIAPPVGVWKDMHNDIFQMIANNQVSRVPPQHASENAATLSQRSGIAVRMDKKGPCHPVTVHRWQDADLVSALRASPLPPLKGKRRARSAVLSSKRRGGRHSRHRTAGSGKLATPGWGWINSDGTWLTCLADRHGKSN
jgi:hypothetical protein